MEFCSSGNVCTNDFYFVCNNPSGEYLVAINRTWFDGDISNPSPPSLGSAIRLSFKIGSQPIDNLQGTAATANFFVLSPYLLGPGKTLNLEELDLATLLPALPSWSSAETTSLAADGTSAAIALFATTVSADVTFETNNGTTLQSWDPGFLTYAPKSGSSRLTVPTTNLIRSGPIFYAAALLQAPGVGVVPTYATSVLVKAEQGSQTQQATLNLVPPPVILVHGLWGNATSLRQANAYLTGHAPWKDTTPVESPCYSLFLAFSATIDPLPATGCETTSADALRTAINAVMAELDVNHIVGGRVDIVAHSMGGLAARNYASLGGFRSPRNRNQGDFHEIVTLNTPETGSLLAPFLLSVGNATRVASLFSEPGAVWALLCGLGNTTVAACFAANAMPLAAPSLSWCTGAIYSLFPAAVRRAGCTAPPSLASTSLVSPNDTGAAWRAIGSLAPANSAPEWGINQLIAAVAANQAAPPTINSVLDNLPNDSIVALPSQIAGAADGKYHVFPGLSHTSLTPVVAALLLSLQLNNNSVVEDPFGKVDELVGCWLSYGGSAADNACLKAADQPGPAVAQANPVPQARLSNLRIVPRIAVPALGAQRLGTPFELSIRILESRPIVGVQVAQRDADNKNVSATLPIARTAGDTAYVMVTPALLGRVEYTVAVRFADGGLALDRVAADVQLPAAPPQGFLADAASRIVLNLGFPGSEYVLRPSARFAGLPGSVDLDGRSVTYRLLSATAPSPIRLLPGGRIDAVQPGTATIEARLGATVASVNVTVLDHKP